MAVYQVDGFTAFLGSNGEIDSSFRQISFFLKSLIENSGLERLLTSTIFGLRLQNVSLFFLYWGLHLILILTNVNLMEPSAVCLCPVFDFERVILTNDKGCKASRMVCG